MARKKPTKSRMVADQAVVLAEYGARALIAGERLRIKTKTVEQFPLDADELATLAKLSALPAKIKKKLHGRFTFAEVASMVIAVAESFVDTQAKRQAALFLLANKLMDCLQTAIVLTDPRAKERKAKPAETV